MSTFFCIFLDTLADDTEANEPTDHDITSPVRSFLERSRRQVEKYFRQKLSLLDESDHDDEEEGTFADAEEGLLLSSAFTKLEDFLNPDNAAIKKLIEHRVLKNPTVLSELLKVEFSDLLRVFENIMEAKSTSVEAAYLHLLQLVEDEGAPGISKLAESDELVQATISEEGTQVEYKDNSEAPSLRLRGFNSAMSDEEKSKFLQQHLDAFGSDEYDEKDEL